jgi:hypothetical protein
MTICLLLLLLGWCVVCAGALTIVACCLCVVCAGALSMTIVACCLCVCVVCAGALSMTIVACCVCVCGVCRCAMEAAGLSEMRVPETRFQVCRWRFFTGLMRPTVMMGARRVYKAAEAQPWYPHVHGAMEIFEGNEVTYMFSLDANEAFRHPSLKREANEKKAA